MDYTVDPPDGFVARLYTITGAARVLGLDRATVRYLVNDGTIATRTIGKRRYIPRSELVKFQDHNA